MCTQRGWLFKWKWNMAITMQRQLMSALIDLFEQVTVKFSVFPDQMKCASNIMLCQHIQDARRIA